MKNIYIVFILLFFSNFMNGSPDSLVNKIGDQFEEFLEYNHNNDEGNFFIYYSDKFQSSPSMPVSSDWFEESHPGLTPFKTEIVDLLNEYNNKDFAIDEENEDPFTGKLHHYVVVLDITWAKRWKELEIIQKIQNNDLSLSQGQTTNDLSFKEAVEEEYQKRLATWKKVPSTDPVKFFLSFVFINKKLGAGGFVDADVTINRARPLNTGYYLNKFAPYVKAVNDNYQYRTDLSLAVVYEEINFFINYFWEQCNPLTPCSNLDANVNSEIAGDFVTHYCGDINEGNDPFKEKKQVLLHAAEFLDFLEYAREYESYIFSWDFKGDNHISTTQDIRDNWWDITDDPNKFFEFLDLYFTSPSPPQFHDYLKEYYDLNLANFNLSSFEKKYLKYFIKINCPNTANDLVKDMEGSLAHYKVIPISTYLGGTTFKLGTYAALIEGVGNYSVNDDFNDQLTCANDLIETEKPIVVDHFLEEPARRLDLEEVLWNEILAPDQNEVPFLGPTSLEIAGHLSNLIVSTLEEEIPYQGDENPDDGVNDNTVIVTHINKSLFPLDFAIPVPVLGGQGVIKTQAVYEASVSRDESILSFEETYCSALKFELNDFLGIWFNDDCMLVQDITEPIGSYDFFDVIYSVEVKDPGFFKDGCIDDYGNTCKNNINLECAFVTATRLRQERFDHIVNDVSNVVSVITLPFSVSALTAARGLQLLKHGIFVANDVASLAIQAQDQSELNQKFVNTFGPTNGQFYYTTLIQITAVISGLDLADVVVTKSIGNKTYKTIKDFSDEELTERIALAKYSLIDNDINANDVNQGQILMKKGMVGSILTMESTIVNRRPALKGLIEAKLRGLYPSLKGIDVLSDEGKELRELIHLYRGKQAKIATDIVLADRIDEIIDGMEAYKINRLKLDLKSHVGLKDILTEFDDIALNANRMKAWSIIDGFDKTLKSDFASLKKLADDITENAQFAEYIESNLPLYSTWELTPAALPSYYRAYIASSGDWSFLTKHKEYLEFSPTNSFVPAQSDFIKNPKQHVDDGDMIIQFDRVGTSGGSGNNVYIKLPSHHLLDPDFSKGGLVNNVDEIRDLYNDPAGVFLPREEKLTNAQFHKRTGWGIRDSKGNHSVKIISGNHSLQPGSGVSVSSQSSSSSTTIVDFGNGKEIIEYNYPATMVPSKQGWDHIGNSVEGSDPVQLIQDIRDNGWIVYQQKTNNSITTVHDIPLDEYNALVTSAFVEKLKNPSISNPVVEFDNFNLTWTVLTYTEGSETLLSSAFVISGTPIPN